MSSRAAQTARDLSSALPLSRNMKTASSSNAAFFAVAEIATERSLGALRLSRDDTRTFLHWPRGRPLLKSRRALDGPTSPHRRSSNLRLLRGGDSCRALLSKPAVSLGHLDTGTELRGFSPARRPQGADPSGVRFPRDRSVHPRTAAIFTGRAGEQSRVATHDGTALPVVARSLGPPARSALRPRGRRPEVRLLLHSTERRRRNFP